MQNIDDIIEEAKKCLNCKKPLCKSGCPVQTNIPEFISEVKNRNLIKAYEILQENNIMSDICSNVCPHEEFCSGHCIKGLKGEPVKISTLEKQVNLWARENNIKYRYNKKPENGIKIAVIGAGPAGITCATELAKQGFTVTIFEKEQEIGGLLTYGIPGFRLPRQITKNLTNKINELKININTNIEFGIDITIQSLKEDGYKAIFIAVGAEIANSYSLTSERCEGIYKADYILRKYNNKEVIEGLGDSIIIGGGNVATDSARAALRMGATSATIVYRKSEMEMPARKVELEEALKDGVKIKYNAKVIRANTERNDIKSVECIKTVMKDNNLLDIEDSNFILNSNSVIFAIGLNPNIRLLESQGINIENRLIKTNEDNMTNIYGVFAGGDVTNTKSTVCNAIKDGKNAANNIRKFINELN